MSLYIFSDAHLGCGTPDQEATKVTKIAELLALVQKDGDRLVVLGDLFDFWFEYKYVIPKAHHEVLFLLRELTRAGIQVDYISGNHDFWMGDFFEQHLKIPVHRDTLDFTYDNLRFHLTHGDGLAKADGGYRFLKRILRNRFNVWLYRKLPPDWAYPLARFVSGSSRNYTSRRDHEFAADYAAYASNKLRDGYNVVVIGHLHIPVIDRSAHGIYINTGDFITHFTYLKCANGAVTLESLTKP